MSCTRVILAIESAIGGGSLSLIRNNEELDSWRGIGDVSRAEDLLQNIDLMLRRNEIEKAELTHIAVSVGPGSFTGIRIGLATAMGIASALNIDLIKYSILHAMTGVASPTKDKRNILAAVPVGRGVTCTQRFLVGPDSILALNEPTAILTKDFDIDLLSESDIVLTPNDSQASLAGCLAKAVNDERISRTSEPLFISKPASI